MSGVERGSWTILVCEVCNKRIKDPHSGHTHDGVLANQLSVEVAPRAALQAVEGELRTWEDEESKQLEAVMERAEQAEKQLAKVRQFCSAEAARASEIGAAVAYRRTRDFIASLTSQPDTASEAPRCGGSGWVKESRATYVPPHVPREENFPCPGCPDCCMHKDETEGKR